MPSLLEDLKEFQQIYDGYDLYELLQILIDCGIINKSTLLEKYWDEIDDHIEEILPFSPEEEEH